MGVLTHLGRKEWNNWNEVPVQKRKDAGRKMDPWTPISATTGENLSRSEGAW